MRRGQKSQSHTKHQRAIGRYHSPYQRGGTILRVPYQRGGTIFRDPPNPWGFSNYKQYELDPWLARRLGKQKGGKVHPVIYPWKNKGRKRINRRRKRR